MNYNNENVIRGGYMKTIFYHGTDIDSAKEICLSQKIDISKCSVRTDFGQGFYITDDYNGAVRWAKRKAKLRGKSPAVISVYFDVEAADNIIERFSDDLRWGRFIINIGGVVMSVSQEKKNKYIAVLDNDMQ